MISAIQAKNYRCFRYVYQELENFQVLVGPNASGKTTFLDIVGFLGDLVSAGLDQAVNERTTNFFDLPWNREGKSFELAVELKIPNALINLYSISKYSHVRYEVSISYDDMTRETSIDTEKVLLKEPESTLIEQRSIFPVDPVVPITIITPPRQQRNRLVVNKVPGGNDNFYSEVYGEKGKGWAPSFKLGPKKSALGNLPEDETKFPVATWLKYIFTEGIQKLVLNSLLIRKPSPPGQLKGFKPDGSNLPWVIDNLKTKAPSVFNNWIKHLRTALPEIYNIDTIERPEDRHRYLVIEYPGGLKVPSWMVSDGTLRLLALTLPAYLPDFSGVYLIEEPENGIHPKAVETLFQSLSSVYTAQILLATHSAVILSVAKPSQILCFSKTSSGAADIVDGSNHPALKNWKGETNLGVLFAGGVLG